MATTKEDVMFSSVHIIPTHDSDEARRLENQGFLSQLQAYTATRLGIPPQRLSLVPSERGYTRIDFRLSLQPREPLLRQSGPQVVQGCRVRKNPFASDRRRPAPPTAAVTRRAISAQPSPSVPRPAIPTPTDAILSQLQYDAELRLALQSAVCHHQEPSITVSAVDVTATQFAYARDCGAFRVVADGLLTVVQRLRHQQPPPQQGRTKGLLISQQQQRAEPDSSTTIPLAGGQEDEPSPMDSSGGLDSFLDEGGGGDASSVMRAARRKQNRRQQHPAMAAFLDFLSPSRSDKMVGALAARAVQENLLLSDALDTADVTRLEAQLAAVAEKRKKAEANYRMLTAQRETLVKNNLWLTWKLTSIAGPNASPAARHSGMAANQ